MTKRKAFYIIMEMIYMLGCVTAFIWLANWNVFAMAFVNSIVVFVGVLFGVFSIYYAAIENRPKIYKYSLLSDCLLMFGAFIITNFY